MNKLLEIGEEYSNSCECGKPLITRRTAIDVLELEHMGQTLRYMDILKSNFTSGQELLDIVLSFLAKCHEASE